MSSVFISGRAYESVLKLLKSFSAELVLIPDLPKIYSRTAYHADLSLCVLGDTVVCAPSLYEKIEKIDNFNIIKGEAEPQEPYPYDVLYNAAVVGKHIFCNLTATDRVLIEVAKKNGFNLINVKQGYARCSTLPVTDSALITSDNGICSAALKSGLDVLYVSNEDVLLEGYPNGFIGGTGGVFENRMFFCGDITQHRDFEKIKEFCGKYSVEIVYTSEPLRDFGSVLC